MIELVKEEYKKVIELADSSSSNRVYPLSIAEGFQKGQIYVDSTAHPHSPLLWHHCGFGYVVGEPDEDFLAEVTALIRNEKGTNPRRLVLEVNNPYWEAYFSKQQGIIRDERYSFTYEGEKRQQLPLPDGFTLHEIDSDILSRLQGLIIPCFSWDSGAEFLRKGKGFCLLHGDEIAATAFSSAISHDEVDIGIETAEAYRRQGCAVIVAKKMVEYVLETGKRPVWECHIGNIGSRRTAGKVGFVLKNKYSFFKQNSDGRV